MKPKHRPAPQLTTLQGTDSPCPCGSGKVVRLCCLQPDGKNLRIRLPSLIPAGAVTGYANPGCYLSMTNNCSTVMSGEHYISKSVLAEIGNTVYLGGVLWLVPDTQKVVGINSMTANILCARHNSSLSPLDEHAGKFMRTLKIINTDFDNSSPITPYQMNYLVSGEIIEYWMLKVLLGIYFSKNAGGPDGPSIDKYPLDMRRVLDALYKQSWGKRCGLYVACRSGTEIICGRSPPAKDVEHSFGEMVGCSHMSGPLARCL
jgi:hypothetical protein